MKRSSYKILGLIMTLSVVVVIFKYGFEKPPEALTGSDLKEINRISDNDGITHKLNQEELEFWKSIEFKIVKQKYPGETPDYKAYLLNDIDKYAVIYNDNSEFVYFKFSSDMKYGWFNSPPAGGWVQPLYFTSVSDKLLRLIKYER